MPRYFIQLSYKGTAYHGWQRQPDRPSVQETVERAVSVLARQQEVLVVGAGRTDAGVHAEKMIAHVDLERRVENTDDFAARLNALLPPDVAVQRLWQVDDSAHARYDAVSRRYEYRLTFEKSPFLPDMVWRLQGTLDFEAMNRAAARLADYTDFTSFSKLHTQTRTNLCTVTQACWERRGGLWVFTIEANRFLRNMVRAVVGTLVEVGRHKITVEDFCRIIERKDRCEAGMSVPAGGLFLVDVRYADFEVRGER